MCTVTFFPQNDHNWMLSTNRDEMKNRQKALPPLIRQSGDLSYIAPVDGKAGGTWIGLNSAGICLTIMNNYQGVNPRLAHREDAVSRGLIIPGLMHLDDLNSVDTSMQDLKVTRFNPFKLVGIQSDPRTIMEWSWDGQEYTVNTLPVRPHIWVSSGKDYEGVFENRRKVFEDFIKAKPHPEVRDIQKLHASGYPEPGAYSIAMEQDIVATVSNTIAGMYDGELKMHYHDGKPVKSGHWEEKVLNKA